MSRRSAQEPARALGIGFVVNSRLQFAILLRMEPGADFALVAHDEEDGITEQRPRPASASPGAWKEWRSPAGTEALLKAANTRMDAEVDDRSKWRLVGSAGRRP